jgi:pantoate ligase/cytidylate kinase
MQVQKLFDQGERSAPTLIRVAQGALSQEPDVWLDYFEIVDPGTLDSVETISGSALAAAAALVGTTRLIDNITLEV